MTLSTVMLTMFLCGILGLIIPGVGYYTYLEYRRLKSRLPEATEWDNLSEKISLKKAEFSQLQDQIREMQEDLVKRDYAISEMEECRIRKQEAENDLRMMEPRLRELEEVNQELATKSEELAEMRRNLDDSRNAYEQMERQIAMLPTTKKQLEWEIETIQDEIRQLKNSAQELETLQSELNKKVAELKISRDSLEDELQKRRAALEETNSRVHGLTQRAMELESDISSLDMRKASLQGAVATAQSIREESLDKSLEDLVNIEPECLKGRRKPKKKLSEEVALEYLFNHLDRLNLSYSRRVLKSFHTNLKISHISPMVALAGISGTGKSELPKRYSEAMGLHFLQVAVQPRWDSPQDLFGFYNYLEQRYKATELARSMVRLDQWNWPDLASAYRDKILMVLLDEMNLARVEYYFSEFLSRLEGRKSVDEANELSRQPVEIELDLGKKKGEKGTRRVFPSQNVLFVGTMNEDESTQSMSDKVIDRAPVIRFARPKKLENNPPKVMLDDSGSYLPFTTWMAWRREVSELSQETRDRLEKWITRLNESLDVFGRPFGHRLNQAILGYVANHPDVIAEDTIQSASQAFADQLEQRIFPKLRGIEMDDQYNEKAYKDIKNLVTEELHDEELAKAFEKSREKVLFSWVGVQREDD